MSILRPARRAFLVYSVFSLAAVPVFSEETSASALEEKMDQAWRVAWERFFHPETETFMDYLSSYESGQEQAHLPTAAEVARQYPNPCGYSTGMEDGMILGGAVLSLLCDRHAVTGEDRLREDAARVFRGMRRCATVHGVPGFVARNVCPEDRRSVYINSSRDQYTHFVHGLWKYHRSPLADEAAKEEIRSLLAAAADRMIEFVTPENDYDFCRADGERCPLGICRMWEVDSHEAARLPMIHAAAWDATGGARYHEQWRRYVAEAVEQSAPGERRPAYALLQMQASLELLHELEPDGELKDGMLAAMREVSASAEARLDHTVKSIARKRPEEMRLLGPDWRKARIWIDRQGYMNPQWGPYREVWHLVRETGESALIPLMAGPSAMSEQARRQLREAILQTDYLHNSSCGIVYHLAAYWKARRHGVL